MSFERGALRFLAQIKKNNNKAWFEAHRADYENGVREPMRALIEDMNVRFAKFAPEIRGDSKRSMFRIHRDIRFSKDKSPYKTHAACWFNHRDASHKVGGEANEGSAGFYFHLEPGKSFVGGGLWMPPRPSLDKLRDAIVEDHASFTRMVAGLKVFGGLDTEMMLKRMPRGYAEDHPGAKWLRYQSFVTGRAVRDAAVTSGRLAGLLARDFERLLPLVRWLNRALGYRSAAHALLVAAVTLALSAFPSQAHATTPAADTAYFAGGCFAGAGRRHPVSLRDLLHQTGAGARGAARVRPCIGIVRGMGDGGWGTGVGAYSPSFFPPPSSFFPPPSPSVVIFSNVSSPT